MRSALCILRAEKRPRQDSNLQPRDWCIYTESEISPNRRFADSDSDSNLRIVA
nr:MAG TPA: hypothetical protein [Caudoviricetes sp.]